MKPTGNSALTRFLSKPTHEQRILIEALLLVALTRFLINFMPFKVLSRMIGRPQKVTQDLAFKGDRMICKASVFAQDDTAAKPELTAQARSIARAVLAVSRRVPWHATCLVQASAGKIMLTHRGLPGSVYLGVNKTKYRKMEPHAWLTSDSVVILGGGELEKYAVVSAFT